MTLRVAFVLPFEMLTAIDFSDLARLNSLVSIWNAACGADLAVNTRFVEYNTRAATGGIQAGQIATVAGDPAGFILASALPNDPQTSPPQVGWIDAIAVAPKFQHRRVGSGLLEWAESWLRSQHCTRARLGGGLRPFFPGLPVELGSIDYFKIRGYAESRRVWDVARDLNNYPTLKRPNNAILRLAQPADAQPLLEFLRREFPNRWRFEFEEFLRTHGDVSNYYLLITSHGIDGFAHLTFEDSHNPIERCYMHRLPRPWGQLGPIGVSKNMRGQGMGRALLDASLNHLHERGVRGCLIDWTDLVEFYRRFGFEPYREYALLAKELGASGVTRHA